jgi:prophage DNA circulation protein
MTLSPSTLQQASFKGANFLVDEAEYISGRKVAIFEYPNQDTRNVEDLGLLPPIIEINGIITGDNYYAARDALIAALTSPGSGELVHPFYGQMTVTADPFRLRESMTNFGAALFRMTFYTSSALPQPSLANNSLPQIGRLSEQLQGGILDDFESIYYLIYNAQQNYSAALSKMNSFVATLNRLTFGAIGNLSELNEFTSGLNNFSANLTQYVGDATSLGSQTQGVLTSLNNISSTPSTQYSINSQLFSFGSDDVPISIPPQVNSLQSSSNSAYYIREERLRNNYSINNLVNVSVIANAYVNASLMTYQSQDEIDTIQAQLEEQYQFIINSTGISPDTIGLLEDLRLQVTYLLEKLSVNVNRVISIYTPTIPLTILTYNYYGSLDDREPLSILNQLYNPALTSGDINIFTGEE